MSRHVIAFYVKSFMLLFLRFLKHFYFSISWLLCIKNWRGSPRGGICSTNIDFIYSNEVWAIFTLGRFGPYLTQFECHVLRFKRTEVITFVMSIQRIKHLSPSYADLRINSYGHIQHGWCQVFFQRHFPKDDFPSDNFVSGTFTNLQFSKRLCWPSGAPQAVMGAEGCG